MSNRYKLIIIGSFIAFLASGCTSSDETDKQCITFVDAEMEKFALANWDPDGDKCITFNEAALVTEIPDRAFYVGDEKLNNALTTLDDLKHFPNIAKIGSEAFKYCKNPTSVSLPNAQNIGDEAFAGTWLTSVSLPKAKNIGDYAFYNCPNLTNASLPNAQNIGDYAFKSCPLTSVSLPNAENIGDYAFYNCNNLTSVSLPNAKNIGDAAFGICHSLASISLPNAVYLGSYIFENSSRLTDIQLTADHPITFSDWTFKNFRPFDATLTLHASNYFNTDNQWGNVRWKKIVTTGSAPAVDWNQSGTCLTFVDAEVKRYALDHWDIDQNNCISPEEAARVSAVPTNAFSEYKAVKTLSDLNQFPNLTKIGSIAFRNCTSLTSVSLSNAADIGKSAFEDCTSLTSVSLPNAADIGTWAFRMCTSLTSISLPNAVYLGSGIFDLSTKLTDVQLTADHPITFSDLTFKNFNAANAALMLHPSNAPDNNSKTWGYTTWKEIKTK